MNHKKNANVPRARRWMAVLVGIAAIVQPGCGKNEHASISGAKTISERSAQPVGAKGRPLDWILVPQVGGTILDEQIRIAQRAVQKSMAQDVALEKLGWLFVAKARISFDSGYYKLAEQCALSIESRDPTNAGALLLRGHVLHNLHRFKDAEPIARLLATQRGSPMDFGLLGDVLMEQGRLDESVDAYQRMMDLRPDSRAYSRAAHVRWLKGDLSGAEEIMREAVGSVGRSDPEAAAWMNTRLAFYEFQLGRFADAHNSCAAALRLQADYPPALLLEGRMFLIEGKTAESVARLEIAARSNPLPEYFWALAEALKVAANNERALLAATMLTRRGQTDDPRTYSLYLATQREQPELAVRLACRELEQRADVTTYDALAWAQFAAGDLTSAQTNNIRARAEGTQDARIFLHSAAIATRAGEKVAAADFLKKTFALRHLLWPSERRQLENTMAELGWQPSAGVALIQ